MHLADQQSTSTFTTQEYARLAAYRAAVLAGFYTDWDGSVSSTDTRLLARLRRAEQRAQVQPFSAGERQRLVRLRKPTGKAYPFTVRERQQLAQLRKDIAAGTFAEDQPPPSTPVAKSPATDDGCQPLAE